MMFVFQLLIKPVKFRLLRQDHLTKIEQGNLKLLATLLCYIVRQVSDSTEEPLVCINNYFKRLFNKLEFKKIGFVLEISLGMEGLVVQ
jgi:hypothetical protein